MSRLLVVTFLAVAVATGTSAIASPASAAIEIPVPPLPVPVPPLPTLPPLPPLPTSPVVDALLPPLPTSPPPTTPSSPAPVVQLPPLPPLPLPSLPTLPAPLSDVLGALVLGGPTPPTGQVRAVAAPPSSSPTSVAGDLVGTVLSAGSTSAAIRSRSDSSGTASVASAAPSAGDLPGGGGDGAAGDTDEQRRAECFIATVNGSADVPQCDPVPTRRGVVGARGVDESPIQVLGAFAHTGAAILGTTALGLILVAVGVVLVRVRRARALNGSFSASTR